MTTTQDPNQPSNPSPEAKPRRPRRRWLFAGGIGLLAAFAGVCATRAFAHPGFRRFGGGVDSSEKLREHMERGADFALWKVDATTAQRQRVEEILDRAAPQLYTTMSRGRELRKAFMEAVANGDRTGAESARKQALTWADESSKLWLATLEEGLAVLNTDQRAKVRESMTRFGHHHGPHD